MPTKVLIANRGEIAIRVAHACRALGLASVAVHTRVDAAARHVRVADESVALVEDGDPSGYMDVAAVVDAALVAGADAVHPGYGFLAESAALAEAVERAGLVFVGPRPETIAALGDKDAARRAAVEAGVPVVPGSDGPVEDADVVRLGRAVGWPVVVKAALGGGGRGMRVAHSPGEVAGAVEAARREAVRAFGDGALLAERYVTGARHVEVQVLADAHGTVLAVGDRECSVQRRHQKLVEEAPAPGIGNAQRRRLAADAERLLRHVGYRGAGTVEFLVDGEDHYFLEVNTRIQVEHTVTEEVTGLDLVALQLSIADGDPLGLTEPPTTRGHAIEMRLNAEDPTLGFAPASGRLGAMEVPTGVGLRVDTGYGAGDVVPPDYDSLLAKLVVRAGDRDGAVRRAAWALGQVVVDGLPTTLDALGAVIGHDDFRAGRVDTTWFERVVEPGLAGVHHPPVDLVTVAGRTVRLARGPGAGTRSARRTGQATAGPTGDGGPVTSPMTGVVLAVHVAPGEEVAADQPLVTVEAMKMENVVRAPSAGVVAGVAVSTGDPVGPRQELLTLHPTGRGRGSEPGAGVRRP